MRRLDRFGLVLPVLLFSLPALGAAPEVKTVPALGGDAAAAHDVLAERPTTLKGTSSVAGPEIQATWEFGDESAPFVFTVTNGHDVSARHTYSGAVGTVYTARLTVVDRRSGEASSARYQVKIGENTLAVGAAIAIDEGLWYLHRTMNRATGDWQGDCGRACNASGSVTASNVLAFEAAGFLATGDASNPYTETVDRALRTLVRSTDPALRTGDWVRALEAADTPERVVENGPADVMGRTFGEIVSRTLETQNLKAKASGARAASANVTLEAISSLIGRQNPAGYWTNESDEAQASFETATAVFAVASNFRSVASTISIVSSQVQVTSTGFLFSRVTQTFNGTMTVKNISGSAIAGPIVVVLTNLPVNVTLANAGGTFNGSPYIVVPAVALLNPGQSASVVLRFANPGNAIINFVPVTYSGTFPPNPVSVGCPANTGTEGTPYNSAVLGNGGVLPYTFSIGPGTLPGGLTLNAATGAITGNPNASGVFNFTANVADGTGVPSGTASAACSINVTGSGVSITVQTVPAGLTIVVDGNTLTAPQVFNWVPGSNHTIATTSPQGSGGTRYVFNNWSDAGPISHAVTAPGSATTFTATFDTEYQLTTAAGAGGTVSPASGTFFAAGSVQNVTATANSGFVFANWTGPVANANSAATTVTMSGPVSVTANFTSDTAITVQTVPAGLTIIVDGNTLTAPQVFNWTPGSNHTIATTTPQGSGGTRYVFNNWSDAGAIAHVVVTPGVATTFTANFDTEYQLTTAAGAGGTVTPASGTFFAAGSVQNVSATANSGFAFNGWTGPVASSTSAATTVTMSGPVTVTAAFATLLTVACPATTTALIGTPYSDSLVASGGTAAYTYSLQPGPLPPPLVLAPGTGLITGTPTTKGTYSFVGKAVDSTSPIQQTATANCVIVVPNRAPTATGQSVSTNEDIAKVITLAGSDLDGDALTFTIVTPPAKGVLGSFGAVNCSGVPSNCTRNVTYTPNSNVNGPDSFTFKVNDGTVDSGVNGTVTVTINAVNDAPLATAKAYNGFANMRIVIPAGSGLLVGATDPGDPENGSPVFMVGSFSATSPAGGAVSVNTADGSFTFDPPPGVTGNVSFTYTVCDNGVPAPAACSAAAAVTVNVAGPVIWFVNTAAAGGGNGTLLTPFNTLAGATTAMGTSTNQRIFVYSGIQTLGTGVTLPADGWLVGQGVTGSSFDTVMGITPPVTAIARPSISGTAPTIRGTVNMNGNNVHVQGLSIQPGSGVAALAATLTGPFTGLVVSDIPNITGTGARAVDLRNVSGTFTLTSVNASSTDIGINLSNLNPSTGSFSVVGGGGTCSVAGPTCSGGTIANVTDTSVKLVNAKNVTLTRTRLANSSNFGLNGSSVTNLTLETCLIDGAHGDALNEGALYVTNWLGSGTINSSHITGGANDNIRVVNNTGVLNRLTISSSTITNPSVGPNANHGLRFATNVATNTGSGVVMNLTVTGSTFRNNRANHFDMGATGLSTMDLVLNGNTFVTNGGYTTLAGAINITNDHQSDVTFDVNNNSFNGAQLSAVNFFTSNLTTNAASLIGKFRNNAIGTAGVTNSASAAGSGFQVSATGAGAVTMNITGNAIRNWGSNYGIDVAAGDGSPTMNFTVTGNTLNLNVPHPTNNLHGVHFNMGTTAAGAVTACVDVGGAGALVNTVNNAAPATGSEIRVRQRNSSTVRLPGFSSGTAAAFLFGRNTASDPAVVTAAGTFSGGAACTQAP